MTIAAQQLGVMVDLSREVPAIPSPMWGLSAATSLETPTHHAKLHEPHPVTEDLPEQRAPEYLIPTMPMWQYAKT